MTGKGGCYHIIIAQTAKLIKHMVMFDEMQLLHEGKFGILTSPQGPD